MEDENIAWSDMPIDEHQINHSNAVTEGSLPARDNKDEIVYILPINNVFWGYLTMNVISQKIKNLDKFITNKFYIIGKNKKGVKKLYEYRKLSGIMYVCNDKKLYTIKDNTLVETLSWDYSKPIETPQKKPFKQVYKSKIFVYTWMYLDNFYETDKLIDSSSGDDMPLPNNIKELTEVKFYFITNDIKNLFKIRKGNTNYYIADDGNLYMIDENNNLIPGVFKGRLQQWYEVNRIEDI